MIEMAQLDYSLVQHTALPAYLVGKLVKMLDDYERAVRDQEIKAMQAEIDRLQEARESGKWRELLATSDQHMIELADQVVNLKIPVVGYHMHKLIHRLATHADRLRRELDAAVEHFERERDRYKQEKIEAERVFLRRIDELEYQVQPGKSEMVRQFFPDQFR